MERYWQGFDHEAGDRGVKGLPRFLRHRAGWVAEPHPELVNTKGCPGPRQSTQTGSMQRSLGAGARPVARSRRSCITTTTEQKGSSVITAEDWDRTAKPESMQEEGGGEWLPGHADV